MVGIVLAATISICNYYWG